MMSPMQYAYAAASGAVVVMGLDFYLQGLYLEMTLAALVFLFSLWMCYIQPSNVEGGLIVQLDPFKVHQFVADREIHWCGNKILHDMHAHYVLDKGAPAYPVVCLGHDCKLPEVHMERVVVK